MNILVTGGAGYIGSHAVRHLLENAHRVVVVDNLVNGHSKAVHRDAVFRPGAIEDESLIKNIVQEFSIEAVMNFAAFVDVGESVAQPAKYYDNNFSATMALVKNIYESGVKKFIFSSTATVYGIPASIPIKETDEKLPISPYGQSKSMVEDALGEYDLNYTILRYFNVAGAHPDGSIGEDHRPEPHLIPNILMSALNETKIKIFGDDYPTPDGTCIRDFIHVQDVVRAHSLALESANKIYNLGNQRGFSILEIIAACEEVTGKKIKREICEKRPGDSHILVASSEKIERELGWRPQYPDIKTMIEHAWHWHNTHPHGYN